MISWIKEKILGEDKTNEQKIFNILHSVVIIGLFCAIFLVYFFIQNRNALNYSICILILAILTFIEANRTGHYVYPAIIMSVVFNFLYFPMLFFYFDSYICCIPVYFIFGLLYSLMLIPGRIGTVFMMVQSAFFFALICMAAGKMPIPYYTGTEDIMDYFSVYLAVIVGGLCGGIAVHFRASLHRKETEKLEEYHVQVMDAYISKDIFLINMSHEIRTPMNAIVGTVNLLLDEDVNERVKDSVYNILNSCNALLSITNELMDLSKSEESDIELYNTAYDIGELIHEIINMMSVRMMDGEVDFLVDIDPGLPRFLYGDSSKIRQLFINILNNAVKYTKSGYINLRVNQEKTEDDGIMLKVSVEDTGIGIKEESIPTLFDVYQRAEENAADNRNVEGTGLGLSICKEIVDKLGGTIGVVSKYHVGSTFSFSIPQQVNSAQMLTNEIDPDKLSVLVYEHDADSNERLENILMSFSVTADYVFSSAQFESMLVRKKYTHIFIDREKYMENIKYLDLYLSDEKIIVISKINQPVSLNKYGCVLTRPIHALNVNYILSNESNSYIREVISKGGFACPNANILVVDDNLTNLNVARGLLKKYEANVITALSGKECLNILESQDIDLVFLDYMMPEMNGIDTLNNIRLMDDPRMKTLPVIALTANVVNGAREMFLKAGFNDYISKPIEVDRIEKALKTFISRDNLVGRNK